MKIETLQAGRAIAAIAVIAFHASFAANSFSGEISALAPAFRHGELGVDFFFVLSGFIIYWTNEGRLGNAAAIRRYGLARARRIYLPYLPIGVAMALAYTLIPAMESHPWTWGGSLTLLPLGGTALGPAWTLQHEVLFYAFFALAFSTRFAWAMVGAWAAIILLLGQSDAGPWYPFVATVNLNFILGLLAAAAARRGISSSFAGLAAAAALAALYFALGEAAPSILFGLAIAVALPAVVGLEGRGALSVPAWLGWLGGASYSLYLVHVPAIAICARLLAGAGWATVFIAAIAVSLLAGAAYHLWLERPALAYFGRLGDPAAATAGQAPIPGLTRRLRRATRFLLRRSA